MDRVTSVKYNELCRTLLHICCFYGHECMCMHMVGEGGLCMHECTNVVDKCV